MPFEKFGRHDWIRTNDPHHVKVVLQPTELRACLIGFGL